MQNLLRHALAAGALGSALFAQSSQSSQHFSTTIPPSEGFESALETWRLEQGSSWRGVADRRTGQLELLFGGAAAPVFTPRADHEADWFALARHWVSETEALHGVAEFELRDERFVFLPLGMANGTDKITVRLNQVVAGLPVEGGKVNVLFDTAGRMLSLQSTAAPSTADLEVAPAVSGREARQRALETFSADTGVPALNVGLPLLLFAQIDRGIGREAVLAYQVSVQNDAEPAGYLYTIDAVSGEVLRRDDEVHYLDVTGTITSMATPGVEADHGGNPPAELPMPYIDVSSSAGTVQTDRDGNFVFPGVNTPLDITVTYEGTFNDVDNQAGSDFSITFPNVQPNQANTLKMNPVPSELLTAQANAYLHVNVLRDYIRDTNPADSTADFKALSNANINSSCNAFFNGSSVNYFRSSSQCNNTAYSTVVAHEMGHWLNVLYGTGNGSDGMGEGNADVFAMYVYDDPTIAAFFFKNGGFIRTGTNTRQFCGDCCGGCYGGVHADGEVWMGAAWKVRRNLKATLGDALGGATADQLFVGWMNAYDQTQIKSIIELQWLALDDDDGNIDNGTPNYPDIDDAFREQGFPGFDVVSGPIGTNYCGPANLNSTGQSASMGAFGVVEVADNDVRLDATQMALNQFGYFLTSLTQDFVVNPGGSQGNLCLGGAIGRYSSNVLDTGGAGEFSLTIDLTSIPTPSGPVAVLPGETWNFQAWFRDKNPDQTSNFTDGLAIQFL